MSKVFLIKAASAISEIAESAKRKMGMGTSKQYDPSKADVNKNGETEAWEKAIAMKRGFKGAPKAKADCPCGEPNCDCSEEGTKKEAGAVSEAIETVGKKVGGMFAKGKEKGEKAARKAGDLAMRTVLRSGDSLNKHYKGLLVGSGVTGAAATYDKYKTNKENKQNVNNLFNAARKKIYAEKGKTRQAEQKVEKMKNRGIIDRITNKDV